jgi:hypothetical protein
MPRNPGITEFEVIFSMFSGLFHHKTDFITSGVRRVTVCHEATEKMRADPSDSLYRK